MATAEPDAAPPRMVYDDDCGFCTWCAALAVRFTDVEPVGFSQLSPDQRARLPEGWEDCMHLLTDDAVYSCGEGMEQTLARFNPAFAALVSLLRRLPGYPALRERVYRFGADHRDWWGQLIRRDPPVCRR